MINIQILKNIIIKKLSSTNILMNIIRKAEK